MKWEYDVQYIKWDKADQDWVLSELRKRLEIKGEEGWELVSHLGGRPVEGHLLVFKRSAGS